MKKKRKILLTEEQKELIAKQIEAIREKQTSAKQGQRKLSNLVVEKIRNKKLRRAAKDLKITTKRRRSDTLKVAARTKKTPYSFKKRKAPIAHDSITAPKKIRPLLEVDKIKGAHRGENIFILGNGKSLRHALRYKEELERKICISVYVAYWLFKTKYVMFPELGKYNKKVYEELLGLDSDVFVNDRKGAPRYFNKYKQFVNYEGVLCENYPYLINGGNSLFLAINLAYLFGAKNIILIGVDFDNGGHFYDDSPKFYYKSFYQYKMRAKPNIRARYPHQKEITAVLQRTETWLSKRGVGLINCYKNSKAPGIYKPLGELV